jgi:hypothetical protein
MSEIAAPAITPAAVPHPRASALTRVRYIGYTVIGLQLIGFMTWTAILYNRFSLSWDYAIYHQGWWLIAHGNLNPFDTVHHHVFWQIHAELIFLPLALLYWVWPHDLILQWIQVFAVVAAEAVVLTWICELAGRWRGDGPPEDRHRADRQAAWLAAVGLILVVADPWTWQAVSFDYHTEPLAAAFMVLLVRDLANGRRRAWAWVLMLLLSGDVAMTYVVGAGLGAALANRRARARGLAMVGVGLLAFGVVVVLHANQGSGGGLRAFSYLAGVPAGASLSMGALLKGIITHPMITVRALASKWTDMWSNLAPTGLLGVFFVPLLPVIVIVMLADNLWPALNFAAPIFQNLPLYLLVPAGTVAVLGWVRRRHRRTAVVLSGLVVAQALAWTAVWVPQVPAQWLRVPSGTAATLAATKAMIPPGAEVVASQGVAGRFSDRAIMYALLDPGSVPVAGETWFIIDPTAGIETETTASAMAFIGELAGPLRATLVTHTNGVWVFRWSPPGGSARIPVPGNLAPLQAWTSPGAAGRAVLIGPVSYWYATATGARGYVTNGLEWLVPPGRYLAKVQLATSGPVNVEVWDDTGNVLLARQTVPDSGGAVNVSLPVDARTEYHASGQFSGLGPFHVNWVPPRPGERLEVRVWSPGATRVHVYGADLIPAGSSVIP